MMGQSAKKNDFYDDTNTANKDAISSSSSSVQRAVLDKGASNEKGESQSTESTQLIDKSSSPLTLSSSSSSHSNVDPIDDSNGDGITSSHNRTWLKKGSGSRMKTVVPTMKKAKKKTNHTIPSIGNTSIVSSTTNGTIDIGDDDKKSLQEQVNTPQLVERQVSSHSPMIGGDRTLSGSQMGTII